MVTGIAEEPDGKRVGVPKGRWSQLGLKSEYSQFRTSNSVKAVVWAILYADPFAERRKDEIFASGGLNRAVESNSR